MFDLIFVLEMIGTISFAVSGAMSAIKKHLDLFGVVILGLVTATGGGVIRDLILGVNPPLAFVNPVYGIIAIISSFTAFVIVSRNIMPHDNPKYELLHQIIDTIGLGVFTVVGIRYAHNISETFNLYLVVFVGVITGVGGGVLRDVLTANTPYIFVKHVYASACLVGALVSGILWTYLSESVCMIVGSATVILIRVLAIHYKWNLPKL